MTQNEMIAEFAKDLFTNGQGERAVQLRMVDEHGKYLGGWSEAVIATRLQDFLQATIDAGHSTGYDAARNEWHKIETEDDLPKEVRQYLMASEISYRGGIVWNYRILSFDPAHPWEVTGKDWWSELPPPYQED